MSYSSSGEKASNGFFASPTDRVKELFGNLAKFHATSTGFIACCPAHEDRTPSLSISLGSDGRILVRCHAGCEAAAVMRAIGRNLTELFDDNTALPEARRPNSTVKPPRAYATIEQAEAVANKVAV